MDGTITIDGKTPEQWITDNLGIDEKYDLARYASDSRRNQSQRISAIQTKYKLHMGEAQAVFDSINSSGLVGKETRSFDIDGLKVTLEYAQTDSVAVEDAEHVLGYLRHYVRGSN